MSVAIEQANKLINEALNRSHSFQWLRSDFEGPAHHDAQGYIGMSLHAGSVTLVEWTANGQTGYDGTLVKGMVVVRLPREAAKQLVEAAKSVLAAKEKMA